MLPAIFIVLCFLKHTIGEAQLGVYKGPAPYGPQNIKGYEDWLGKPVVYATEFEAGDNWGDVEGGGWWLGPWSQWVNDKNRPVKRYLVISVPMLPCCVNGVTIAQGADGAYNSHFRALAQNLVSYNLSETVIRLGWEFNGGWYPWRASLDVKNWPKFWIQIVTTMRSIPGQKFQFAWNPTNGWVQVIADTVYPGDEYVDIIGLDLYDQIWDAKAVSYDFPFPQRGAWHPTVAYKVNETTEYNGYWRCLKNNTGQTPVEGEFWTLLANQQVMDQSRQVALADLMTGSYGMNDWLKFAKEHNKPLSLNEWGLFTRADGHGGGDNPLFIQTMYNYISNSANNILFHSYFDVYAFDGNHLLQPTNDPPPYFPQSAALFAKLFGKG